MTTLLKYTLQIRAASGTEQLLGFSRPTSRVIVRKAADELIFIVSDVKLFAFGFRDAVLTETFLIVVRGSEDEGSLERRSRKVQLRKGEKIKIISTESLQVK